MLRYAFWLRVLYSFVVSCVVSLVADVSCVVVSSCEFWIVVAGSRYLTWLHCLNMFFAQQSHPQSSFQSLLNEARVPPENAESQLFLPQKHPNTATLALQDASGPVFVDDICGVSWTHFFVGGGLEFNIR